MTIKRTNFTLSPLYQPRAEARFTRAKVVHGAGVWIVQLMIGLLMVAAGIASAVVLSAFGG